MSFVHLHRHSDFSLLDGAGSAEEYAERCAAINQPALAITDHGNLCGAINHIEACNNLGIQPILGMEAYFKDDRSLKDKDHKKAYHTTLWSLNLNGWHNLMRLSSEAYKSGFYYRPCADWQLFEEYGEGLAASTGCIAGPIPQAILNGDDRSVSKYCQNLKKAFGDNVFVEIMPHKMEQIRKVNLDLIRLANEHGWPVIATVDAHYPEKNWAPTQDVMLMISTGQTMAKRREAEEKGEDVYKFDIDTLYLMEREEVENLFAINHPEIAKQIVSQACDNTMELVSRIEPFVVDKSSKMPKVTLSEPIDKVVGDWCQEGLRRIGKSNDQEYIDRLDYELSILSDKKVLDYFYLVGDLVRWAKSQGIRVGIGRGSAAGCLVSYLIGITNIDPLSYGLLFERFLNPSRASMPDIDLDFQHDRREEAKQYLGDKWGSSHVVDIAAFQTFQAKSSIKDVSRVLDVPLEVVIPVSNALEEYRNEPLESIYHMEKKVSKFADQHPEVWDHAQRLQGHVKTQSKHPAGVVVTDKPVTEYMPLMRGKNGETLTQWSEMIGFNAVTEYGFLKIDILGTDGLTRQKMTLDLIKQHKGIELNIDNLEAFTDSHKVDDDVMEAWQQGDTFGIFQFSSSGITRLIKQMKPTHLEDLVAANALYRPGPLQSGVAFSYGKRKHGQEAVDYWHPALEPYMDRTYGLLVYQEQVMKVVEHLGGFSLAEADTIRKAITKWIGEKGTKYLDTYKNQFIEGAVERGIDKLKADEIWDKLVQFASYAFNASHSACYAAQAYQDMYLKVKYPLEFYAALLTIESDEIPRAVKEAKSKGISVLPPNINTSESSFSIDGGTIRFGLSAVKYVGVAAVQEIIKARADGPFESYDDFCERVAARKCNKRVKESLISSGAFDVFGARDEWKDDQIIAAERELLGMPLTVDVVRKEDLDLIDQLMTPIDEFVDKPENALVVAGGEIIMCNHRKTKAGKEMCIFSLNHRGVNTDAVCFPNVYQKMKEYLYSGNVIMVRGSKDDRGGIRVGLISPLTDLIEVVGQAA